MKFVKIIIKDGDKILQHYFINAGKYDVPAGMIEYGETESHAAARELLERTGYSISEDLLVCKGSVKDKGEDFVVFEGKAKDLKKDAEPGERGGYTTKIRWVIEENIPYFEDKESPAVPDKQTVERDMIYAIVVNKAKDEVLCLDWYNHNWKVFLMGGIDDGEDIITAAKREVEEETGYTDIKFIAEIGKTRTSFYAAHKGVNRISNATALLFELISEDKKEVAAEEEAEHHVKWIPTEQVAQYLNAVNHKYIWDKVLEHLK